MSHHQMYFNEYFGNIKIDSIQNYQVYRSNCTLNIDILIYAFFREMRTQSMNVFQMKICYLQCRPSVTTFVTSSTKMADLMKFIFSSIINHRVSFKGIPNLSVLRVNPVLFLYAVHYLTTTDHLRRW